MNMLMFVYKLHIGLQCCFFQCVYILPLYLIDICWVSLWEHSVFNVIRYRFLSHKFRFAMKFPVLSAGTYLNIAATSANGHNMDTVVLWRV